MITNNSNNNIVFYDKTQSVNAPLSQDPDVNYHGNYVEDKSIDVGVTNPLYKRKINFKNITIGLPFRITCKLTLDILKSDKKCLYPHISIANEVYCLLTDLQMRSFFKNKVHLVCPFLEQTKQRLKIIPPNIMSPFHITNINGNKFNLVPKSKLSFHIEKVAVQTTRQSEQFQASKML